MTQTPNLATIAALLFLTVSCSRGGDVADAYGHVEVDVTIISAQTTGELVMFQIEEGATLDAGVVVGIVDTVGLHLRKLEVMANRKATASRAGSVLAEIAVQKDDLANLEREQSRITGLVAAGSATQKALDDIDGNISVVRSQIASIRSRNATILGEVEALDARIRQIDDDLSKSRITNPMHGVVLAKLAETNEFVTPGKALYKIANVDDVDLRAFVSGSQLSSIALGAEHEVRFDGPDGRMISYPGTLTWIATEAEFTPKTIQTKEQRVDLVYAVKIRIHNDGRIKIGMPGELWLTPDR